MSSIFASDCVLLHADGLPGCIFHRNGTTAEAVTSIGAPIEVSLSCPERPVLPTILFVQSCTAFAPTSPPTHRTSSARWKTSSSSRTRRASSRTHLPGRLRLLHLPGPGEQQGPVARAAVAPASHFSRRRRRPPPSQGWPLHHRHPNLHRFG